MYTVSDKRLGEVYPGFSVKADFYRSRIDTVLMGYKETFGGDPGYLLLRAEPK